MSPAARRRTWAALMLAAFADALLAPFYPQLFERTFAASATLTPGLYVAVCRMAVATTLPLWTRWARRVPPLRLVAIAQGIAGVTGLACAAAPTLPWFLGLSFVTEAARTSYLLLYPVLVEAEAAHARGRVVASAAALVNGAMLVSALAGGLVLGRFGGRAAIAASAALDFAQLALLYSLARGARGVPEIMAVDPPRAEAALHAPSPSVVARVSLAPIAAISFLATFAFVLLRPHFTLLLERDLAPGAPLWLLGAIFALPSAVAVVALPFARRWVQGAGALGWLAAAAWVVAATAWAQGASVSLLSLVVARIVYGVAVYVADVSLDYVTLCTGDGAFERFGWVHALQNVAIVAAPLAASALASDGRTGLLFVVAALVGVSAALVATIAWTLSRIPSPVAGNVKP